MKRLLIANRGEIALRIARAAAGLGIETVAVYSKDDEASLHRTATTKAALLPGQGAAAYLDMDAVIAAAKEHGCCTVHPGYGFLAERADFAERCGQAGLLFVGPSPDQLRLFGDKGQACQAARAADLPVLAGLDLVENEEEAAEFFRSLGDNAAILLKALAGGGGRGTRVVRTLDELPEAFARCRSEAASAFGVSDLYVEEFLEQARHIEVQLVGDGEGTVVHLGERECSVQRRHQKMIEIAPAPLLSESLRRAICDAAVRLLAEARYLSLGTCEFLVDQATERFFFLEVNARLQVEHTVTEEVTGVDLVRTQLRLARGESLADLGLDQAINGPNGYAIESRVCLERFEEGQVIPASGVVQAYEPPGGPGVRTDGFGYAGYETSMAFDSLLAKVIVHSKDREFEAAASMAERALAEFRLEGVANNLSVLRAILRHEDFSKSAVHTRWVDEHLAELIQSSEELQERRPRVPSGASSEAGFAGARVDTNDPLALFDHDARVKAEQAQRTASQSAQAGAAQAATGPEGTQGLSSPIQGTVVSIDVAPGDHVQAGQQVAVVEAMKMEHVICAKTAGVVRQVTMVAGDVVREGFPLVFLEETEDEGEGALVHEEVDLDYIRPDLAENYERHAYTLDENRPEAVAKREERGHRMIRTNIAQLVDEGSFKEYWPLVVAKQHLRHDMETLRKRTPADGVVAGTCSINADLFGEEQARAMVVAYDYSVLAGTQGHRNHYKQDRMFELAQRYRLPLVLFGEGGGGRPGDDYTGPRVAFDTHTFTTFSKLSGLVPLVSIINGRTFAGNTALVAACDVIIATEGSTVGMGGPAMIEGGGLGIYTPEEVGPMSVQVPNGVVDILVRDEDEAVDVAKKYLSYFQGTVTNWSAPEQRRLRHVVPENRLRLYDMRDILRTLADEDSVLEIRRAFGVGVITAFIRIEGRPMGVIANNPHHLAGAIDSDGADKGARFLQLCDAFDIPVLSLMDCPGIMVGPDVEKTALVRHALRMFNVGANMTTPLFGVIVRKAYGLGVQAMCGASALVGFFTVAWPTAEFAGMNIEGAVKLGYRNELAAIEDPEERRLEFEKRVALSYERAKAVNAAVGGGLDDVIDPAETRSWIASSLKRLPKVAERTTKKYPYVDPW